MERFKIDLKTFWAWSCLTIAVQLSECKYWSNILEPKSPNRQSFEIAANYFLPHFNSTTCMYL